MRVKRLKEWLESYFFGPQSFIQRLLSWLLSPLGVLWCLLARIRRARGAFRLYPLKVIGVGNLVMGGSGKTPMAIWLAQRAPKPAIVLRGYGRQSRGLLVAAHGGVLHGTLESVGDEAMEIAAALPQITVIVAEKRAEALEKAMELGAQTVILDDGFGQVGIKKTEILLEGANPPPNRRCIPAGPWREAPETADKADIILREGRDFWREVTLPASLEGMLFVSAISKPTRLEAWLPASLPRRYFPDHHPLGRDELEALLAHYGAKRLLVTGKDAVKVAPLRLPYETIGLKLCFSDEAQARLNTIF